MAGDAVLNPRHHRAKPSEVEKACRADFRELVLAEPCLLKQTRPEHECRGAMDPHHVLKRQWLEREFPGVWNVIDDPELGVALCRQAHANHHDRSHPIYLEELPARVLDRCAALSIDWKLRRDYPSITSEAAQMGAQGVC